MMMEREFIMVYEKLPLRKHNEVLTVLLDMREIEMKANFPITSGD